MIADRDLRAVAAAVDGDRVLERLDRLAQIGAGPEGGVTRIAFSVEEAQALDLVGDWLTAAGLSLSYDSFGNLFGSTDANAPDAAPSISGSHLDTVPNGGRFDGTLGVVAAVEAIEAMRASGLLPERQLEVVVWRCEEPVRFSQGKAGSLLFTGALELDELMPLDEDFDVRAVLAAEDERPLRDASRRIASCLELHIEQGRRLERAGLPVGVVTAVAAPARLRMEIRGRADHSGATPMDDRQDALVAAAELILAVEASGAAESAHASAATTTRIVSEPGAMNVVPGKVELLVDVRGVDLESMERVVQRIIEVGSSVSERRGVGVATSVLSRGEPTRLDDTVVRRLAEVVEVLGWSPLLLPSGAGHDAQCLVPFADVGMLFVPSVDGISHSPREQTGADDVVAGSRALAAGWLALASR